MSNGWYGQLLRCAGKCLLPIVCCLLHAYISLGEEGYWMHVCGWFCENNKSISLVSCTKLSLFSCGNLWLLTRQWRNWSRNFAYRLRGIPFLGPRLHKLLLKIYILTWHATFLLKKTPTPMPYPKLREGALNPQTTLQKQSCPAYKKAKAKIREKGFQMNNNKRISTLYKKKLLKNPSYFHNSAVQKRTTPTSLST